MINLKKYLLHHLGLVFWLFLGFVFYIYFPDFLLRNFIVLISLFGAFLLNIYYHIRHADLTSGIVLEYFLISLFVYLLFLFVHLF